MSDHEDPWTFVQYPWGQIKCGQRLAICQRTKTGCRKCAVFWKFLFWNSLLILLGFSAYVQILQYMKLSSLLYTSHSYFFSHESKKIFSSLCHRRLFSEAAVTQDTKMFWLCHNFFYNTWWPTLLRVAKNWTTHPLPRAQKLMNNPSLLRSTTPLPL